MGLNPADLLQTVGYAGLFAIIFAESGILLGFFLPGDSLLFTAGFLASQGYANIAILLGVCFAAAVLGDSFGYAFGKKVGPRVFTREDGWLFRRSYVERMREFYSRHGGRAIMLARFTPVIRTFAPIFAGVAGMPYRTFLAYNIIGALLWAVGITGTGYMLGQALPGIDGYLLPVIVMLILISMIPTFVHFWREHMQGKK